MNIISSNTSRTIIGFLISVLIPHIILCLTNDLNFFDPNLLRTAIIVTISHFISSFYINSLFKFPGVQSGLFIGPTIFFWFAAVCSIPVMLRIPFSYVYISIALSISILYRYAVFFLKKYFTKIKLAVIPLGAAKDTSHLEMVEWTILNSPDCITPEVQAIVVDLHSEELSDEWQNFLANSALQGMPVYNIGQVEESLTGRVKIRHMYENDLGSLTASKNYTAIKYLLDSTVIILSLPLTLLIGLLTAIAIKFDDAGTVIFTQDRVGYKGKTFKIYKFRSMKEKSSTQTTIEGDDRITRVGKFIRKTRIDELPQFINVLKGEMSLIGPRAEYKFFADELEKQVPFYQYRHIVKPGISGWAQVKQGYAIGSEETQVKVEYDFYYIKHYSFTLDTLIFLKTIKTMLTGFGAR